MDKYPARCSSLSGTLSLLTSTVLIKVESESWEDRHREAEGFFFVVVKGRMEWCVLSMLYALVQLLLNRKQMGGREGGEH